MTLPLVRRSFSSPRFSYRVTASELSMLPSPHPETCRSATVVVGSLTMLFILSRIQPVFSSVSSSYPTS